MNIKSIAHLSTAGVGFLLLTACGFTEGFLYDNGDSTPTVLSNTPDDGAKSVPLDGSVSATFSEAMDPATLTASTFTLTAGTEAVQGTVTYNDSTAVFAPAVDLASDGSFLATITTEVNSDHGVPLAVEHTWSFTGTNYVGEGGASVRLRTAGDYVVLANASISGTGATAAGNLGISPAAASYITGFSLIADSSTEFSTSAQVTGKVYAADYGTPTPTKLTTAVGDMLLAYADASGRAPDVTQQGAGSIDGMTLPPGVYKWNGGLSIQANVTLSGGSTDVWIFQIAGTLGMAADTNIVLTGGAVPKNVFWQVSGAVTLGAAAHLEGVVLTATAFTSGAGTSISGRVLSQTDVTITGSTLVQPGP